MPPQYQVAGRIYKIERDPHFLKITVIRDQKEHKIEFAKPPAHSEFLHEGDLIAVVSAAEIILLAPALVSLPAHRFNKEILSQWSVFVQGVRDFFVKDHFLEINTPSLVVCPGTEPSLDVFSTILQVGSRQQKFYLPTSPELHLKKALALGAEKIFEIAPCFRNGEITERHQPEFVMLEWYRAYDSLTHIKKDVEKLVHSLAKTLKVSAPHAVKTYSIAELFKFYCDFPLRPDTTKEELKALAHKLNVDVRSAESIDDYFFLIFMEKIESQLPHDDLIFVEKYPPYQAALARMTEDGWGDRFEVYWKGFELANAFHELNDPRIQRLRSAEDLEKKKSLHKEIVSLDEEFFQCLEAGMPPSGGIALGLERLFMALMGLSHIADVRVFSKS
ncbi:EF-P lysine aminoacylase EpmA [Bdellovibrio sp. 22V]|uniref:EF-P lysine aminoacylase EpmA n=1 Tax=Bdellovibrio TaxID=958 RepID=UPI00254389D3|nr:EF-P lysine aminoacylase EpmA [Bdellovibrio sp. 22V]WII73550.1 EF-P lysine aminoacylase EpmA [Bdellovibrio sp. 22V]